MSTYNSTTVYDAASLTYDANTPGLANLPVVGVFIAFDDGPYVADPDWVEVTDYVREVAIRRGRQDDLQQFPAGQASVVLDNRDRLFDPFTTQTISRRNLVLNPSFERGTDEWATTNVTMTTIGTDSFSGSASLRVTSTSAADTTARVTTSPRIAATTGLTYRGSAYVKNTAGNNRAHNLILAWYDASGSILGTNQASTTLNVGSAWTRLDVSAAAPASATAVEIRVLIQATNPSTANVSLLDAVMLEQSSTLGTYFDGSTDASGTFGGTRTQWTGVAHNSVSIVTSFPYPSLLKPRRQIKIVGQWAGVNYPLFRGFVAGWPVEYSEGGKDSTVTIDCFDALGLLATEVLPTDWAYDYTLSLNPLHYWRFNDGEPATSVVDEIGTLNLVATAGYAVEQTSFAQGLNWNSLFTRGIGNFINYGSFAQTNMTFAGWVRLGTFGDGFTPPFIRFAYRGVTMTLQPSGSFIQLTVVSTTGATNYQSVFNISAPSGVADAAIHLGIAITYRSGNYVLADIYVNGESRSIAATNTLAGGTGFLDEMTLFYAAAQEVSVYTRALSFDEITQLYERSQGRIPESTQARFQRIVDSIPFYSLPTVFDGVAQGEVSEIAVNQSIVGELQKTMQSEGGELVTFANGDVYGLARDYWASRTRSNTSQVTFTDTGTGVYYDAGGIRVELGLDQARNSVTVQFSGGGSVTVIDEDSVEEYGAAQENVQTYLFQPEQALSLADKMVSLYAEPKIRVEPFLVKGQRNPSYDWPRLLALELLDRFTFVRTPSVGSAISKPMLLQSIEHRFTPGTWETIINGSARYTGWFVLDSSLLDGEDVLL